MKRTLILMLLLLASTASARIFDGKRKGFVLGGGLGFAPVIKWTETTYEAFGRGFEASDKEAGMGVNLAIGYAWSKSNMIVYEINAAGYKTKIEYYNSDSTASQGMDGFLWYHYFGTPGRSLYTITGIGFYQLKVDGHPSDVVGQALLLGGGFELARHCQIGVYWASQLKARGPDPDKSHLNVLFTVFAY